MLIPLQITFRGMETSEAVAAKITERARRLERFHDHITACRVVFEQANKHHHQGNHFHVRIDITVPGAELLVKKEHAQDGSHEDPYVVIRDAFDAATRRLEEYVRTHEAPPRVREPAPHGVVRMIDVAGEFGFLTTPEGREVYFHRNAVTPPGFEALEPGMAVRYEMHEGEGVMGPQASTVRAEGRHHVRDAGM